MHIMHILFSKGFFKKEQFCCFDYMASLYHTLNLSDLSVTELGSLAEDAPVSPGSFYSDVRRLFIRDNLKQSITSHGVSIFLRFEFYM